MERLRETGTIRSNPNGEQGYGPIGNVPDFTVLPPAGVYMGKEWLALKVRQQGQPLPEGTTIYRGTKHTIIQNGQEVEIK